MWTFSSGISVHFWLILTNFDQIKSNLYNFLSFSIIFHHFWGFVDHSLTNFWPFFYHFLTFLMSTRFMNVPRKIRSHFEQKCRDDVPIIISNSQFSAASFFSTVENFGPQFLHDLNCSIATMRWIMRIFSGKKCIEN